MPVKMWDPALPAMSDESTPGTVRMKLFFVLCAVQTLPVWVLVDFGSVRNLVNEALFRKLPFQPPIRDPGDVQVIGGNGEPLELRGFTVLPVALGAALLWHEFGVVPELPLEVLIGADILAAQQCSLFYLKNNQKRMKFGVPSCRRCDQFRTNPEVGTSAQLKFVNRNAGQRRNRLKIGAGFVATLPDAEDVNSDDEFEQVAKVVVESPRDPTGEPTEPGPSQTRGVSSPTA